jgi:hypothetical protein
MEKVEKIRKLNSDHTIPATINDLPDKWWRITIRPRLHYNTTASIPLKMHYVS